MPNPGSEVVETAPTKILLNPLFKEKLGLVNGYFKKKSPETALSDDEEKEAHSLLRDAFVESAQISINGDPEYQIEQLNDFHKYCKDFYGFIYRFIKAEVEEKNIKKVTRGYIDAQILEIQNFQNSGKSPGVNIEDTVGKVATLLALGACQYQQLLKSGNNGHKY